MVGQTVGKYRIVDRLGRGGMGTVYRAVDETLHREVAIKVLNTELNDPGVGRRFRAEAVAIARLNHPGIAMIYELVQHEGQWLMVIEFVRGETLEALVARAGPLSAARAAELSVQVLSALSHAHSMGVVHRDLKPANIMCSEMGTTKIMDFGIARVAGTEHLTSAGFMMGTPAYMAPEQVKGGEIDSRTDLYAAGVVLYFLSTAKLPFKGDTPMAMAQSRITDLPTPIRTMRADVPDWLAQITEHALERDLDRRYQTADEMREALRRGLSGLPVTVAPPVTTPPELVATSMLIVAGTVPVVPKPPSSDDVAQTMVGKPATGAGTSPPAAHVPPPATNSGGTGSDALTILSGSMRAPGAPKADATVAASSTAAPPATTAAPPATAAAPPATAAARAGTAGAPSAAPVATGKTATTARTEAPPAGAGGVSGPGAPPSNAAKTSSGPVSVPSAAESETLGPVAAVPAVTTQIGSSPRSVAAAGSLPMPKAKAGLGAPALIGIAAAVVIVVVVAGIWVIRSMRPAAPSATSPSSATRTEPAPPPAGAPGAAPTTVSPEAQTPDPLAGSKSAGTPPAGTKSGASATGPPGAPPPTGSGVSAAPPGTVPPGGAPPGTAPPGGASPGTAPTGVVPAGTAPTGAVPVGAPPTGPGRTGSRGRGAPTDTVLRLDNIKQLVVSGRSGTERDVLLYFGGGQLSVVTQSGSPILSFQYPDLLVITYVRARDPKWDESLQPGPPLNLDVPGGMFRSAKHWLVMQAATGYVLLRLEEANWKSVVDTIEARTGRKVVQPAR